MRWQAPASLEEALLIKQVMGEEVTVHAGGTFLGILMNQGLIAPEALVSLARVRELRGISVDGDGTLHLGAMATHLDVERDALVLEGWPVLAQAFSVVASRRVRAMATVGGVLADADYASDPPSVLSALDARAVLRGPAGEREVTITELILGYYTTCIEPDELLVEVRVPPGPQMGVYRKFRSRSSEDRPCVAVAGARRSDDVTIVVGAVAEVPQRFDAVLGGDLSVLRDAAACADIARDCAQRLEPIGDVRGSAAYRSRVARVEIRRALEDLAA